MNQYKIEVTYTRLDNEDNTITKVMPFIIKAFSIEEARELVRPIALNYINRINGTIILIN